MTNCSSLVAFGETACRFFDFSWSSVLEHRLSFFLERPLINEVEFLSPLFRLGIYT